jgi:hypothetical protein
VSSAQLSSAQLSSAQLCARRLTLLALLQLSPYPPVLLARCSAHCEALTACFQPPPFFELQRPHAQRSSPPAWCAPVQTGVPLPSRLWLPAGWTACGHGSARAAGMPSRRRRWSRQSSACSTRRASCRVRRAGRQAAAAAAGVSGGDSRSGCGCRGRTGHAGLPSSSHAAPLLGCALYQPLAFQPPPNTWFSTPHPTPPLLSAPCAASTQTFLEREALLHRDLSTLIADAQWLKHYGE